MNRSMYSILKRRSIDEQNSLSIKRFRSKTKANHRSSSSIVVDHRHIHYELQCQEALLILMHKLRRNQQHFSSSISKSISIRPMKSISLPFDQQLLHAKLALRIQLEQSLLGIPLPKASTSDLIFIPGMNGWTEFVTCLGLEQVSKMICHDHSRLHRPYRCTQCGTDWTVTWHDLSSTKIICDRCRKTSQKKLVRQDHSNRLRQVFLQAVQQEKQLDLKYHKTKSSKKSHLTRPSIKDILID